MSLLTDKDLEWMRDEMERVLPDTGTVYSLTTAMNGMGEAVQTWTAAGTVNCRLDPVTKIWETMETHEAGGGIQQLDQFYLTAAHGAAITNQSRVVVGATTYNVIGLSQGNSWNLEQRWIVAKV